MTISQYSIIVTTDINGNYGPVTFPSTSSLTSGAYQLQANWVGNLTPVIANFTIFNMVTLNVTSSSSGGFVDCIDLSTGLDVPAVGTVPAGDTIQITAYAQNSNLYQFAGWTDPLGILDALQKMYPQVDVVASTEIYLIANFTPVSGGGGGGSGPTFPAPGTVGDGQYWMYIVFLPAYGGGGVWIGYDTYLDEYNPQDSGSDYYELSNVYGPYASGAIS